jgi:hypothetical protein
VVTKNPLNNGKDKLDYFLCEMHVKLENVLEVSSVPKIVWRYIHNPNYT